MNKFKNIFFLCGIMLIPAASFAHSISVTSTTLESAEAQIAAKAQKEGNQYKIIEASNNNRIHMTAILYK
ncbi:TPA: DUF1471 domain-containing protein [Escherichia coli]|nr:DUF1471 domain-containing protein [Escherichia coli]HBA7645976.1 DUF1471 domain-containing protein [Escherichia coli]HBA7655032.1 DUF1471 domain-containing protein [Escherichia coli]HBA7728436.1 DUF1471 domain-containing protein [Escherichia coli]HBA7732935.1 DUF1471 domain-containing protein [Escherichia coli]